MPGDGGGSLGTTGTHVHGKPGAESQGQELAKAPKVQLSSVKWKSRNQPIVPVPTGVTLTSLWHFLLLPALYKTNPDPIIVLVT